MQEYNGAFDSGFDWLGAVPRHWRLEPLGQHFRPRKAQTTDDSVPALSVTQQGIVPQRDDVAKAAAGALRYMVHSGDFVINSRSDRKGSSGVSPRDGAVSTISIVLGPRDLCSQYVHHLLRSTAFQEEFYRFGSGIVADLWTTRYASMRSITIPVPPLGEQKQIAKFLDYETGEIDAFIADQERLIDLLTERREAVRDGLIIEAQKMVESTALKNSARVTVGIVVTPAAWYSTDEIGVPALRGMNVADESIQDEDVVRLTEEGHRLHPKSQLRTGDVVVVRSGQAGTASVVPARYDECNAIDLLLIRPRSTLDADYLAMLLNARITREQMARESVGAIQSHLNASALARLRVPVPTIDSQHQLASIWHSQRRELDAAIGDAREAIALSRERRAALISAAVTGKIDVRDWKRPTTAR